MMRDLLGGKGANLLQWLTLGCYQYHKDFTAVTHQHVMNIMLMVRSSMMKMKTN